MTDITVTLTAEDGSTGTATIHLADLTPPTPIPPAANSKPPPAGGYVPLSAAGDFPIVAGGFASLPDDAAAAAMVVRSTWEPRPTNALANTAYPPAGWSVPPPTPKTNPYPAKVWARVTGRCPLSNPTTDELIQWCAAKWGLSDEVVRAQMTQETKWYQDLKWSDQMPASVLADFGLKARPPECPVGTPVFARGYGDYAPASGNTHGSPDCDPAKQYNQSLGGTLVDGQFKGSRVLGPESFGIPQCRWYANTDPGPTGFGAYPYTELSTALALDVYGATVRAQYEGWNSWMGGTYTAYKAAPGGAAGVWGSVGNWYSGDWNAALPPAQWTGKPAQKYVGNVQGFLAGAPWLQAGF